MQTAEFALLLAIGAGVWFWADALRARERAVLLCRGALRQRGLQLLDQTVALARLGTGRDAGGRLHLRRLYRFEFSRDGAGRDSGTVVMLGGLMESLEMPLDGRREYEHGEDSLH